MGAVVFTITIIIVIIVFLIKLAINLLRSPDKPISNNYHQSEIIHEKPEFPNNNVPSPEFLEIPKHNKTSVQLSDFRCRTSLLNSNERVFFKNLKQAYGSTYDIYPQMQLGAIFEPIKQWHNGGQISKLNKRIDFVIINREDQSPVLGIELDGTSHTKNYKTIDRDRFVEELFSHNNIPFVRFNNGNYNSNDIIAKLQNYFIGK